MKSVSKRYLIVMALSSFNLQCVEENVPYWHSVDANITGQLVVGETAQVMGESEIACAGEIAYVFGERSIEPSYNQLFPRGIEPPYYNVSIQCASMSEYYGVLAIPVDKSKMNTNEAVFKWISGSFANVPCDPIWNGQTILNHSQLNDSSGLTSLTLVYNSKSLSVERCSVHLEFKIDDIDTSNPHKGVLK